MTRSQDESPGGPAGRPSPGAVAAGAPGAPDGSDAPVVWRLAADDPGGLRTRLADLAATPGAMAADRAAGAGGVRLALVDPSARTLRLADRLVATGRRWGGRSDVWFSPSALALGPGAGAGADSGSGEPSGRVAFLFPGVEPVFGADETDLPALARRFGMASPDVGDDTLAHRSAAIVRLGIFLDRVLRAVGVAPGLVGGHSVGEWSAAVSGGMSDATAAESLIGSFDLETVQLPQVDFAALTAGADKVGPILAKADGLDAVEVSHDNCGRQSVICGPADRVAAALGELGRHGVHGQVLDFRSGFHTSALLPVVGLLRHLVDALPLGPPAVPVWSATTCAPLPADLDEARAIVTRHLVEPVRFRPMVERMYEAGARVFVQPGIGNLTGFVADILDGRPHAVVPVLTPKRPALAQLHRALAALWVEGVPATPVPAAPVAPVVREAPRAPTSTPVAGAADEVHPVLAAAVGLIHNADAAAREVLTAWGDGARQRAPRPAPARLRSPAPPAHPTVPFPATPATSSTSTNRWPTRKTTFTRHLSLATLPHIRDHEFFRQPDDWPDDADRFPIVAMTSQLAILADIAAELSGGRDVVAMTDVRNLRWLDIGDPVDLEVTVTPMSGDTLRIALGQCCRAKVRVGSYPATTRDERAPLRAPRPARKSPDQLFAERLMFHGPRFRGIRALGPIGEDGLWADLEGMPDPGTLLDNVGKLVAYWVMEQVGWGEGPLPIGVDRVEFSGPEPPPGELVPTDVRITNLDDDGVVAEATLCRADGTTWCHVEGWRMLLFHRDPHVDPMSRWVELHQAHDVLEDGLLVQYERWPGSAARDLFAHQMLRRDERAAYEALTPIERRAWLLEVVAVKEATRRWLRLRFGLPSFPVEVHVRPRGGDRWVGSSPLAPGHELHVALARAGWLVAAVAAEAPPTPPFGRPAPPPLAVALAPVAGPSAVASSAALADSLAVTVPGVLVRHRLLEGCSLAGTDHPTLAAAWSDPPALDTAPALVAPAPSRPDRTTIPPETT